MRNVVWEDRVREFVNNGQHTNANLRVTGTDAICDEDYIDVMIKSAQLWYQNIEQNGLTEVYQRAKYRTIDAIPLYVARTTAFVIESPTSSNDRRVLQVTAKSFRDKNEIIEFIVENLRHPREIIIYDMFLTPIMYNPHDFTPIRKWVLRYVIPNWGNEITINTLGDFTPSKKLLKFKLN